MDKKDLLLLILKCVGKKALPTSDTDKNLQKLLKLL